MQASAAKKYMCVSTCQGCPANWKVNTDTWPNSAMAKTRRVESAFPAARHDNVAASTITTINPAGSIQSVPRNMPMAMAIGACSQSTTSNALLVVSRKFVSSSLSIVIPSPPKNSIRKTGGNRLWIGCKPDAGLAQPRQPIAAVRPHHQKGRNGRHPHNGGVGGSRSQEHLPGAPPRWKGYRHHFGAGTDLQGNGCNRDEACGQQCGSVQPRGPSRRWDGFFGRHPARIRSRR